MRLDAWRATNDRSQRWVGRATGMNPASVSKLEAGLYWPTPNIILRIWNVTNGKVTVQDIFDSYVEAQIRLRAAGEVGDV